MYYKYYYDMRYIFHVIHLLYLLNSICALCMFGYKSQVLKKMPYIPNRWDIQEQTKERIQEQSTCILLYNILYYSSTLVYHKITTRSFVHPTVIILCRL